MNDHDPKKNPEAESQDEAAAGADSAAEYAARNAAHYAAEASDNTGTGGDGDDGGQAMPDDPIATLEAEKADLTDRYVRLAAEMENLRKRTERELSDARKYAVTRFAADILSVSDNLTRAKDAAGQGEGALEAIVEGIDVTARDLARILEKHGVVRIPAEGEKFDPNLHQAMFEVPDESVPSGTVVQQVQEGYMIGDRILRAAMVGVSKGGPKQPATANKQPRQADAQSEDQTDPAAGE